MARIVTQDPLSRAPGSFSTGGGISVPNMPAVNTSKAGAIASVLNSAAQALGMFAQVKVQKTEEQANEDFAGRLTDLTRLRESALRSPEDPAARAAFQSAYESTSTDYSEDKQRLLQLTSRFEPTLREFDGIQQSLQREAVTGFVNTRMSDEVLRLQNDSGFMDSLYGKTTDEQLEIARSELMAVIPQDLMGSFEEGGDFEQALYSAARGAVNGARPELDAKRTEQVRAVQREAAQSLSYGVATGTMTLDQLVFSASRAKIPPEDAIALVPEQFTYALSNADSDSAIIEVATRAADVRASLDPARHPRARVELKGVVENAQSRIIRAVAQDASISVQNALTAGMPIDLVQANTEARLINQYGEAFGFDSVQGVTRLEEIPTGESTFARDVLADLITIREQNTVQLQKLGSDVQNAIVRFADPDNADPGAFSTLYEADPILQQQLVQALGESGEVSGATAAMAMSDRTAYETMLVGRAIGTREAMPLVKKMTSPEALATQRGVDSAYRAFEMLAGPEGNIEDAIVKTVPDLATQWALIDAAKNGNTSPQAIQENINFWQSLRIAQGSDSRLMLDDAMKTTDFVKAAFGLKKRNADTTVLAPEQIAKINALVPIKELPDNKKVSPEMYGKYVKNALTQQGYSLVVTTPGGPGSRQSVDLMREYTLPESANSNTLDVQDALNSGQDTPLSRWMGNKLAPNAGMTVYEVMYDAYTRSVPQSTLAAQGFAAAPAAMKTQRLRELIRSGEISVVVDSLAADNTGVPIRMLVKQPNQPSVGVTIGKVGFNDYTFATADPSFFQIQDSKQSLLETLFPARYSGPSLTDAESKALKKDNAEYVRIRQRQGQAAADAWWDASDTGKLSAARYQQIKAQKAANRNN